MESVYRFAGLDILIESVFDAVHQLCKEYRSDGIPCFAVRTDAADIAFEREKAAKEDIKEGRETNFQLPAPTLEDTFALHASGFILG